MHKLLMWAGAAGPLVYVIALVLGGWLWPGYSHIRQPVSDLIGQGAPNKAFLDVLFAIYNLLVLGFGFYLFSEIRSIARNSGRVLGILGAAFLITQAIFGLATLFFPEDIGGMAGMDAGISSTGMLHIIMAGLSSLASMLALLFTGLWYLGVPETKGLGRYSLLSLAVVFVSGGIAAMSVANQSPIAGLLERITILGFIQWVFVMALITLRTYGAESKLPQG
jgi:hypothetical protein